MLLFGYIISDTKHRGISENVIKVVKNEKECTLNIPKLIVGLENAKKYALSHNMEFDILNHKFKNGDMWTFKKTEKREIYEENVLEFEEYIKKRVLENVLYYYINIFQLKISDIKRLYNIIINNNLNRDINNIVIDNNMLYYPLLDNKVIGISFQQLQYINISKEKIIKKIKKDKSNHIYYTNNKTLWDVKKWFEDVEYVIPVIL